MKTSPEFLPLIEADARWAAAADRVGRYLRAHRLASPAQIAGLTADIIGIARARARPGDEPMRLAMETMHAGLGAWFAQLLPAGEPGAADLHVRGRVALALGEVPARWPGYFMRDRSVPVELVRVMREADLGRAPAIKFSNMAPRPIAAPAATGSRRRWQWSYLWPFGRMVSGLAVVLARIGVIFGPGR